MLCLAFLSMCFAFKIVHTSLLLSELCLAVLAMVSECTTSPDLFYSLPECQCFLSFVLSWFGCDIELYLWPHFGIGTRSVWSPSRFGFNIGLCLWLHFSIGIRSAWLHSKFSSTVVSAFSHVSLVIRCKRKRMICFFHFSPGTLTSFDDVVASFSYRRADSSVTAII